MTSLRPPPRCDDADVRTDALDERRHVRDHADLAAGRLQRVEHRRARCRAWPDRACRSPRRSSSVRTRTSCADIDDRPSASASETRKLSPPDRLCTERISLPRSRSIDLELEIVARHALELVARRELLEVRVGDREQAVEREALREAAKQLAVVRADHLAEDAVDLGAGLGGGERRRARRRGASARRRRRRAWRRAGRRGGRRSATAAASASTWAASATRPARSGSPAGRVAACSATWRSRSPTSVRALGRQRGDGELGLRGVAHDRVDVGHAVPVGDGGGQRRAGIGAAAHHHRHLARLELHELARRVDAELLDDRRRGRRAARLLEQLPRRELAATAVRAARAAPSSP